MRGKELLTRRKGGRKGRKEERVKGAGERKEKTEGKWEGGRQGRRKEDKEGREENPREGGRKDEKEGGSWYSWDSDLTPRW